MHDVGQGKDDFIEDDADKVTYTLDELVAAQFVLELILARSPAR
jgi:hypothetical protein